LFSTLPTSEAGFSINVDINTSLLNTIVFISGVGWRPLTDGKCFGLWGGKERFFLSVRGSKGVWGMEDSPTITAKHLAAAGFCLGNSLRDSFFGLADSAKAPENSRRILL